MAEQTAVVFLGVGTGADSETEILRRGGDDAKTLPNQFCPVMLFQPRIEFHAGRILAIAIDRHETKIIALDRPPRVVIGMRQFRVKQIDPGKGILPGRTSEKK